MKKAYLIIYVLLTAFSMQAQDNQRLTANWKKWEHLPGKLLMEKGEYYRNVARKPDSALVCFSIVANRYYEGWKDKEDIELSIEAMTHISYLYENDFGDYVKAISYNLKAKELAEKYQYNRFMPFILLNEANIHGLRDQYTRGNEFSQDALESYKKVFYNAQEQKNWYAMLISFMNMMLRTTFHNKESLIEKEMDIVKNTNIPDSTTHLRYARCLIDGVRAWNNYQPDSSLVCFKKLLEIAKDHKNINQKVLSLYAANVYLTFWYITMSQYDKAFETMKTNEAIAKKNNNQTLLLDSYLNQSNLYRRIKNEKLATEYYIMYLEGKNDVLNKQKLGSAKEAEFLYQLNQKNEEVREMAYRQEMRNKLFWTVSVFSAILLLTLVFLFIKYRQVRERNKMLYEKSLTMIQTDEEKCLLIEKLEAQLNQIGDLQKAEPKYDGYRMDEERMSSLLHRIFLVMETSDEIYSNSFSLPRLAELVGDKRNNVSEAINQQYKTNFNGLLNEYRIKEACRRMNDTEHYGNLTIEYIAKELGFKSRNTFTTAFKEIIGLTPSAYLKLAKER